MKKVSCRSYGTVANESGVIERSLSVPIRGQAMVASAGGGPVERIERRTNSVTSPIDL